MTIGGIRASGAIRPTGVLSRGEIFSEKSLFILGATTSKWSGAALRQSN